MGTASPLRQHLVPREQDLMGFSIRGPQYTLGGAREDPRSQGVGSPSWCLHLLEIYQGSPGKRSTVVTSLPPSDPLPGWSFRPALLPGNTGQM